MDKDNGKMDKVFIKDIFHFYDCFNSNPTEIPISYLLYRRRASGRMQYSSSTLLYELMRLQTRIDRTIREHIFDRRTEYLEQERERFKPYVIQRIRYLVESMHADMNYIDETHRVIVPILFYAIYTLDIDIVRECLSHGAIIQGTIENTVIDALAFVEKGLHCPSDWFLITSENIEKLRNIDALLKETLESQQPNFKRCRVEMEDDSEEEEEQEEDTK